MKPIATTVPIWSIPLNRFKWFDGRCPHLAGIRNSAEAGFRLTWLSEGSLGYQLRNDGVWRQGDSQEEIKLYKEFRAHLAQQPCNQLIKPNGP